MLQNNISFKFESLILDVAEQYFFQIQIFNLQEMLQNNSLPLTRTDILKSKKFRGLDEWLLEVKQKIWLEIMWTGSRYHWVDRVPVQYQKSYLDLGFWRSICQLNQYIFKYWGGNAIYLE